MKQVVYKNCILAKKSKALELFLEWKKTGDNKDRKKLDDHMKDVERRHQELMK